MKYLLIALLAFPLLAQAEITTLEKPVVCASTSELLTAFKQSDFKEIPVWIGQQDSTYHSLFVNEKTKTWTFIQFNEELACVLGSGSNSKMMNAENEPQPK